MGKMEKETNFGSLRPVGRNAGFTLLELLVVLVILGLLAAVATPQVLNYLARARTQSAGIQINNLASALDLFRLDVGRYPTEEEGLAGLFKEPDGVRNWYGPYVKKAEMLNDPWGRPYKYRMPGETHDFDLYTLGADNAVGGEGENKDVTN
jgi:general secretion pathway protein G